jgi:hypothetical protein
VKVRTADTASLGRLLRTAIGGIRTVRATKTTIVLETVKEGTHLPLPSRRTTASNGGDATTPDSTAHEATHAAR